MSKIVETPMLKQYNAVKKQHPDALLLYRCGDFYETYGEDAVTASAILGITLTMRGKDTSNEIRMAGFPYHAIDTYLPKLVRAGWRVAICDQLEDPKLAKGIVKRGITELVTPGVSYNDNVLENKSNNFVACLHFGKSAIGLAFLDISTGEFLLTQGTAEYVSKLIANFAPKEVLYEYGKKQKWEDLSAGKYFTFQLDDWMFTTDAANNRLKKQFDVLTLKGFGVDDLPEGVIAAGGILHYLDATQHLQTAHITNLKRIEGDSYVWMDKFTIRNLELYGSMNGEGKSFISILDKT
ncbi:MAG TPA: DNA mismatch repair protein MutS, partial [Candidatus Enterocola sp.]|nr:DNA mismatch repair protein MutS [Candidatus Enterocola sp.]